MQINFEKIGSVVFQGKYYSAEKISTLIRNYIEILNSTAIERQSIVGICMYRCPEMIAVMIACLYKGVTFIPIDPENPNQRIEYMLEDCRAAFFDNETAERFSIKESLQVFNVDLLKPCSLEQKKYVYGGEETGLAYIIFTSGTTGVPKGVEISYSNLENLMDGICDIIPISPENRFLCCTTMGFDIFFVESILPLLKGATVILANEAEQRNPRLMANLIKNSNVDIIQLTPSRAQLLYNFDKDFSCLENVTAILIGGEVLPKDLLFKMQRSIKAKIYNMYGPTETTIWSCVSDLSNSQSVNIGKPIRKTVVFILDDENRKVNQNEYGQIAIAGAGVAIGYHNNKELTESRFITVESDGDMYRTYLTGDWGRCLADGTFECIGRRDNQIKIHGFRVELEEIESVMMEYNTIYRAVVCKSEGSFDALIGFYLSQREENTQSIREFLEAKLPSYMIPARIVHRERFPLTNSGKIDRKRLLQEYWKEEEDRQTLINSTTDEESNIRKKVVQIIGSRFTDVVQGEDITQERLINLGIDSISFIVLILDLEKEFEIEFDDNALTIQELSTIDDIVKYIEKKIFAN